MNIQNVYIPVSATQLKFWVAVTMDYYCNGEQIPIL